MTASKRNVTRSGAAVIDMIVACAALIGASCGGGSSAAPDSGGAGQGGGGGSGAGGAVSGATTGTPGCAQVATAICTRELACAPTDAGALPTQADCVRLETVALTCDLATTQDFGGCINVLRSSACADLASASSLPSCAVPIDAVPLSPAQMKCGDFVLAACQKSATCQGITPTAAQLQNCQARAYADFGCSLAMTVGTTFNQCITDLGNAPCVNADGGASDGGADGGAPLPSCATALTFAQ